MLTVLGPTTPFPPLARAMRRPNGLLALGGQATPERLIEAEPRLPTKWTPLQSHYYDDHACDS